MDPLIETWKSISGYEGYYEISSFGKVKGLPRVINYPTRNFNIKTRGKILTPYILPQGMLLYALSKGSVVKRYCGHTLVASAFLPNAKKMTKVGVKDGDWSNIKYTNLYWKGNKSESSVLMDDAPVSEESTRFFRLLPAEKEVYSNLKMCNKRDVNYRDYNCGNYDTCLQVASKVNVAFTCSDCANRIEMTPEQKNFREEQDFFGIIIA